ncbi:MAG: hypothetical protein V2A79_08155 [Planctomycetota bacterium]
MSGTGHHREAVGRSWFQGARFALLIALSTAGCSALNPSAINVLFPADVAASIGGATTENAPGHVVIIFINNTHFDGNVLNFLRNRGIDVDSDPNLRPRARFQVQVLFSTNVITTFEFVDGSAVFDGVVTTVDANGVVTTTAATPPPDLTENTLNNMVVLCNVAAVAPAVEITETTSSLEMFVPTSLKEITVTATELGLIRRELKSVTPPRFVPLVVDAVDETGAVTEVHNFGTRDVPGFPTNLTCGSVVTFVLNGDLTLPFVVDETNANVPGYLDTDTPAQAAVPGRFELIVSVR